MNPAQAKVNLITNKKYSITILNLEARRFIKKKMLLFKIFIRVQSLSQQ